MDVQMPIMDGLEATRRIRADLEGSDTVIIALTASALDGDRRLAMESGVSDFLSKPLRENVLLKLLQVRLGLSYQYAKREPAAEDPSNSTPGLAPIPTKLEEVEAGLLAALRQAVVNGEKDTLDGLIQQVEEQHGGCAGVLRELADKYEYDALTHLLEEARP
jgi:CheY-like chemotaxis protein